MEEKVATNAIYIFRIIIERAPEVQKDVYLCFIDYTKAFDRVRHNETITQLAQLQIDGIRPKKDQKHVGLLGTNNSNTS